MRLLLDTHTFLWFTTGDPSLSAKARLLIQDPNHEPIISLVSLWEIAIKTSIGKLKLAGPYEVEIPRAVLPFDLLPITLDHTSAVAKLPFQPNHNDPFDRLLVAQAVVENMPIISADAKFDAYANVSRLW